MTQPELACANPGVAHLSQHRRTRHAVSAAETDQHKGGHTRFGLLIVLTTAAVFYGGIFAIIWKVICLSEITGPR